jgi:hypothetical protein
MLSMYTLHVLCPHCGFRHAITAWPAGVQDPVLFTCLPKWGGCGGQALVHPPETTGFPNLEEVFVVGHPLSPRDAARLTREHGTP